MADLFCQTPYAEYGGPTDTGFTDPIGLPCLITTRILIRNMANWVTRFDLVELTAFNQNCPAWSKS